VPLGRAMAP